MENPVQISLDLFAALVSCLVNTGVVTTDQVATALETTAGLHLSPNINSDEIVRVANALRERRPANSERAVDIRAALSQTAELVTRALMEQVNANYFISVAIASELVDAGVLSSKSIAERVRYMADGAPRAVTERMQAFASHFEPGGTLPPRPGAHLKVVK